MLRMVLVGLSIRLVLEDQLVRKGRDFQDFHSDLMVHSTQLDPGDQLALQVHFDLADLEDPAALLVQPIQKLLAHPELHRFLWSLEFLDFHWVQKRLEIRGVQETRELRVD